MNTKPGELVMKLEVELFDPTVRHSKERLDELIADDFLEYTSSGRVTDKNSTLQSLSAERALEITAHDMQTKKLGEDFILVSYSAQKRNTADGAIQNSLRSSIWRNTKGRWQIIFHQGTSLKL